MSSTGVAVVTGASRGLGAAIADRLASQGYAVGCLATSAESAAGTAASCASMHDVQTVALGAHVEDREQLSAALEKVEADLGPISLMVNNAGIAHVAPFEELDPADFRQMVDVNLRAPIYLTGLALPHIRRAGGGAVVMVGSLAGRTPLQGAATYASTKAGLKAFTASLADELTDSGINVGVVSPGPIDTAFIMDSIDEVEDIVKPVQKEGS